MGVFVSNYLSHMKQLLHLLLLFSFTAQAQELLHCGADEMRIETLLANPKVAEAVIERDAVLETFTRDFDETTRGGQIYTIPVVFHVIHKYGNENISREQILDGLDVLNATFRKQIPDTADIHPDFKPIHADCEIEFKLATKDPEGNCHSGINRIASSLTNSGDHRVKDLIHWNPSMYLNVYIVSNAAGLAGHAVWPADADTIPDWDGIVMGHNYVGRIGTSSQTQSVVFAHECGHYLNLHHIWGGNNVPEFYYLPVGQQANCNEDDLVGDTPNTIGWSSCSLNASSCGSPRDNVQNAMDYSYCNVMFTEGQKARMHACLNSSIANRNNLWTPANLAATGVEPSSGFCAADFIADNILICNPSGGAVNFSNTSFHGAIDSVRWTTPGGDSPFSVIENPTVVYYQPGSFDVTLTAYSNGQSQTVTKPNYITVLSDSAWSFPFMEWFGANTSLDSERWFGRSLESDENWQVTDQAYFSADHSLMMDNWDNPLLTVNELYSPPINLSNATEMRLAFRYSFASSQEVTGTTRLVVQIRKDCESNWATRLNLIGNSLETAPQQSEPFEPLDNTSLWELESVNIPATYLTENFQFRFVYTSEGRNRLFIDDVNIDVNASIEETSFLHGLTIYPNPTEDQLNIAFSLPESMKLGFTVFDLLGKQLLTISPSQFNVGESSTKIDVRSLSSGVYFLSITSDDGQEIKRFTVR